MYAREGLREASVEVRVARAIEHRKHHHLGRRDSFSGRRQYVRSRYDERTNGLTVSKIPWTHVHILSGPERSPHRPEVVQGRKGKAPKCRSLRCTMWRSQMRSYER